MALQGFVESEYLAAKLAALVDSVPDGNWESKTTDDLKSVLAGAGYTPEEHYQKWGWQEGLGPNDLFNPAEYKLAKATDLVKSGQYGSLDEALAAFKAAWPHDPYLHYLQYGSYEGINPSNQFDESSYLAAKLELLQTDESTAEEWADKDVDDVLAGFKAAGLTVLGHYLAYGKDEGLSVTPVPADEIVIVDDGVPGDTFTLTEIRTVEQLPDTYPTQTLTYWGNPETGDGVPAGQVWGTIQDYLSTAAGMTDNLFDINTSLAWINNITITGIQDDLQGGAGVTVDEDDESTFDGDYTGNYQITVELSDGTINTAIVELTQAQYEFLNGLLFDEAGNSRLFEKEVAYQVQARDADGNLMVDFEGNPILVDAVIDGGTIVTDSPIVLTPRLNNGGTEETGFTSAADDVIIAARLELLHGAYIDGGGGVDTLEIDAKGHFAQPKELLNIEHVKIENLPNVYTVADADNSNGYPDVQEDAFGDGDSIIDLSRATGIETLTITEGNFEGLDGQQFVGSLTVAGIRNGVTTTLDGGFFNDVTLHYGELSDTDGLNLVFHNLSMGDNGGDAQLNIAQNAETLNIEAVGAGNFLGNGYLGGQLSTLNITGDAHLYIAGSLDESFQAGNPAVIDASANTGGVNLTINDYADQVTFTGTAEAFDRFTADNNGNAVIINGGNGNNEFSADNGTVVTVNAGDGNNVISAEGAAISATITAGEGNNTIDASSATGTVSVTTGDGDNIIDTSGSRTAVVNTGAGDDTITSTGNGSVTIDAGEGDNTIEASGSSIAVTAGAGKDSLLIAGAEGDGETTTGGPPNLVLVLDGSGSMFWQTPTNAQAQADAVDDLLDSLPADTAVFVVYDTSGSGVWTTKAQASQIANGLADGTVSGTWSTQGFTQGVQDAFTSLGGTYNAGGQNNVIFITDGANQTLSDISGLAAWEAFLSSNKIISNAIGIGATSASDIQSIDEFAYDGINDVDIDGIVSPTSAELGALIQAIGETIVSGGGNGAQIQIDLGAGENTLILGNADNLPQGLTALEGSSITGDNITLIVNSDSDLRAADLTGADITSVVLDDGIPSASGAAENAVLTLTDVQFAAIGAENFSVEGAVFNTYAQVHIIVTQDTSLTDLGVDNLSRNIDLTLEIQNEVTLEMTAEQLHTRVAPNGVTLSDQGTDDLTGSVLITGAGLDFDPFNTNDQVRTEIDGKIYYGGSLSSDFWTDDADPSDGIQRDEWGYNVLLDRVMNGYNRPADAPSYSRLVIDTDQMSEIGPFGTIETFLSIVGTSDLTFIPVESGRDEWGRPIEGGTAIELGIDTATGDGNEFIIDFSSVTGTVSNLAVARFEDALEIYGNGARLDVELTGNVADEDAGLFSRGIHTYVVTDMNGEDREFWTSRVTQDLEYLGLQGNYEETITFGNTERGVEFLLEVEYDKFDGYAVGTLVADFARPGAAAVVNVVGLDALPAGEVQKVAGIDLTDAASGTVNVEGGDTVIEDLAAGEAVSLDLNADADLTIESDLPSGLTSFDAAGVAGNLTVTVDLWQANDTPLTFVGAEGGTTLTIDDAADGAIASISGVGEITLVIGDGEGSDSADLSDTVLTNVTSVHLTDGSTLTIDMAQADEIGAANFTIDEGDTADLELMNLAEEPFALANYADGIDVTLVGIAPLPVVTLHPDTDLTGIDSLMVPEGTVLNLTAEQFQQLNGAGTITGDGTVNITDLTQAAAEFDDDGDGISDGLDLSGITANQGTITMAEDVKLVASDDLSGFEVVIGDDLTLTLADVEQADGLVIGGGTNTTLAFTDTTGFLVNIDASGFNVDFLRITDLLVSGNNVDYIFEGLPEGVTKVIYNGDADVEGRLQNVVIEEGTTIFGDISFNEYLMSTEISHLTLNMEGGTRIDGDLVLSTVEVNIMDDNLIPYYLQELIINSSGTGANNITGNTANVIDGDITPAAYGPAIGVGSRDNNLKTVTITADQDLVVTGKILFSSHGTDTAAPLNNQPDDGITANDDDEATATLNISGDADTTIGDLDTSDDDVDYLVVNHTGSGTLTFGLSSLTTIDGDDEITVNGSATGDTIINISGMVDLSDDTLVNVDAIVLDESGGISNPADVSLTLTQAQFNDIGAANITVNEDGQTAYLNINAFEGAVPFDATELDENIDDVDIFMAEGVQTLDPTTDLTGVDTITVPEDGTLNLTAAQFQQLAGSGTITGGDGAVINITDLTQADVDAGFDLSGVTVGTDGSVTVTLAEDVYLAATDDLGVASVIIPDNLTLGLAVWTQADGLVIDGGTDSTVVFQFDSVPTVFTQIDASNYDITTLKALATFIGGLNAEFTIDDLPSSVELRLYQTPEELGFLSPTHRVVFIEEGVYVPDNFALDSLIFNDWDSTDEVRSLSITMDGDVEVDGDISLPTRTDKDPGLIQVYFETLTLISQGTAVNTINGDIDTEPSLGFPPNTSENNLLDVVVNAMQDLVITGTIVFNGVDADDDTATLTLLGDSDVSVKALDTTDADIDTLNIDNLGTGTLTVTGGSDALELDNTESLVFTGTGDIVLDTDTGAGNNGIEGNDLSLIDASGLEGDLTLGVIEDIDSDSFQFISGTGVTTMTLVGDTLDSTNGTPGDTSDDGSGWNFDFTNAAPGSEIHLGTGLTFVDGSILNIDLGANTTLFIDASMDLSGLDLSIIQTLDIVLADGATLTLTAAQANGLNIVAGPDTGAAGITAQVNIVDLGDDFVDLSGIDEEIAGYVTLEDDDVTLDELTDLGFFKVALEVNSPADYQPGEGQMIRFTSVEQADGRVIDVFQDVDNFPFTEWLVPGDDINNTNSTNVAWLFESIPGQLDTTGYDPNIGRLWVPAALIDSVGGDIENLFNFLPSSILRVDFNTVTELDVLLASSPVDRVIELTSFTTITGLTEIDDDILPLEEHIETLRLAMGGEVTIGNIVIGDVVAAPDTDPLTPEFTQLWLNSRVALDDEHYLATEDYVNDNDGIVENILTDPTLNGPVETAQPDAVNTVGDISVGGTNPGIDLLDIQVNTYGAANIGGGDQTPGTFPLGSPFGGNDGADLVGGTVYFDSEVANETATLQATGVNDVTFKSLDTSDADITTLVINTILHTGTFTLTGGSPGAAVDNTETLTINTGVYPFGGQATNGVVNLGTAYDDVNDVPYAGVAGADLSFINVNGNGEVNLGVLALIDGSDDDTDDDGTPDQDAFTLNGNGNTTATLGAANVDGSVVAPTLETGSTWSFNQVVLTITEDVIFEPGGILEMTGDVDLYIEGEVDLTEVDLVFTGTGNDIYVPDGNILLLTVEQLEQIDMVDITGSGTLKVIGDASNITLGQHIKTVNVDLSEATIITDPLDPGYDINETLQYSNLGGAFDDDGVNVGQNILGSDFDDTVVTFNLNDTFTGALGDDTHDTWDGDDVHIVDAGTDRILNINTGDVLIVSSGAAAIADVGPLPGMEFVATAETINDGTATIFNDTDSDSLIDVSLAGGSNGFTLIGSTSETLGNDVLIGSDQDDIINGGNSVQSTAAAADELTGNGGSDIFEFNVTTTSPATLANQVDIPAEDWAITAFTTADDADDDDEIITINYKMNNIVNAVVISDATLGYDIDFASTVAINTAIATALNNITGATATYNAVDDQVEVVGDFDGLTGNSFNIDGIVTANFTSSAWFYNNLPVAPDPEDVAQENTLTVTGTASAGETYNLTVTLKDGTDIVADEFVAVGGETAIQIATAIAANFNAVAPGTTVDAIDNGDGTITLLDENANDGGFTVTTLASSGSFGGSGASSFGPIDLATADVITDFTSGEDFIDIGDLAAGTNSNYVEAPAAADFATALTEANSALNGTVIYYLTASTADATGLLFFDANMDGTADGVVSLLGVTQANFDETDIIA